MLALWRNRLGASGRRGRVFEAVRELIAASGAVAGRERRVLDCAVLDGAVAPQDTVTMLAVQIRRVRKTAPELGEVWVRERNLDAAGPVVDWADPAGVERLVSELTDDASGLIGAAESLELDDAQADAVGLLGLAAGQDSEPVDAKPGRWRIARRTAKGRLVSVVDPESGHTHKTAHSYRDGFKAHIAAEPDTGLVTAADLSPGDTGDADAATRLPNGDPAGTVALADSAYGTRALRAELADAPIQAVINPPPLPTAVESGHSTDDIDCACDPDTGPLSGTVTCPHSVTVAIAAKGSARFGRHCQRCPQRGRCTTAKHARTIQADPRHDLLAAARAQARTEQFQHDYRTHRPMAEHSIARLVRRARRRPHPGVANNPHPPRLRAPAANPQRLASLAQHHNSTHRALT